MNGRDEAAVDTQAYSRFSDQVTDGTYTVIDEINITTDEGGFASIHIARPEENVVDVRFINSENGEPQNAAATIIGHSEWLEPGVHEDVEVPLFEDGELQAVCKGMDRLEEPTVLVSLAHIDSNENQEWNFFDEGDEDPAYNGAAENTENQYAPPSARPTDIAAVVHLKRTLVSSSSRAEIKSLSSPERDSVRKPTRGNTEVGPVYLTLCNILSRGNGCCTRLGSVSGRSR